MERGMRKSPSSTEETLGTSSSSFEAQSWRTYASIPRYDYRGNQPDAHKEIRMSSATSVLYKQSSTSG